MPDEAIPCYSAHAAALSAPGWLVRLDTSFCEPWARTVSVRLAGGGGVAEDVAMARALASLRLVDALPLSSVTFKLLSTHPVSSAPLSEAVLSSESARSVVAACAAAACAHDLAALLRLGQEPLVSLLARRVRVARACRLASAQRSLRDLAPGCGRWLDVERSVTTPAPVH